MFEIYLIICLAGLILLLIFAALGGFGAAAEGGDLDLDVDVDAGDVDIGDADIGEADVDAGMDASLSPLSLPLILLFLTSFGAIGAI